MTSSDLERHRFQLRTKCPAAKPANEGDRESKKDVTVEEGCRRNTTGAGFGSVAPRSSADDKQASEARGSHVVARSGVRTFTGQFGRTAAAATRGMHRSRRWNSQRVTASVGTRGEYEEVWLVLWWE